jgi:hypothetical protein
MWLTVVGLGPGTRPIYANGDFYVAVSHHAAQPN